MKECIVTMRQFLPHDRGNLMSNEEFLRYLDENPRMFFLVSSALREGRLTEGMVLAYHPEIFEPGKIKRADAAQLISQLRQFNRWIATAGSKYGFTVLGTKAHEHAATKPASGRRPKDPEIGDLPVRLAGLKRFCKKVGSVREARALIQRLYDEKSSYRLVAAALSKSHRMHISMWNVRRWMEALKCRVNEQKGGKKIPFSRNLGLVDAILQKRRHTTLARFVRAKDRDGLKPFEISAAIKKATGKTVGSSSMSYLYKRLSLK